MNESVVQDKGPLTDDEWRRLLAVAVAAAERVRVGRRFVDVHGPIGPGVETIVHDHLTGRARGNLSVLGEDPTEAVRSLRREPGFVPLVFKDFMMHWRDVEASRLAGVRADFSMAAGAAIACATTEDRLIFYGDEKLGYEGLMNESGRLRIERGDWTKSGAAFGAVGLATEKLVEHGLYGPYALATSPRLYALMHRVHEGTNMLEIEHVRKIATQGVYQSPLLRNDSAVVVSASRANFDLVVGQDLTVTHVSSANLNLTYRALESIYFRVKRPTAICTLE